MPDERFYNRVSGDRITSRQVDELIGLARGLVADNVLNLAEVEFLQKWLAANMAISDQPLIGTLYHRVAECLEDGMLDAAEQRDLYSALSSLTSQDIELGETLKSSTLPLCDPPPLIDFPGRTFAFTGTFAFGQRKHCENAVMEKGALISGVNRKTEFLVIGLYATESWRHSSMGAKIVKAVDLRNSGQKIAIVSEAHWRQFL